MSTLGNRAALLTLSRLASYGLMLASPLVLVRLLPIAEFGRYREFLLYASLLQGIAMFSINDSLLYFVPAHPHSPWRLARQTAWLTLASSLAVCAALAGLDALLPGGLVGGRLGQLVAYTLLSVNLDFWEFFWLARGKPLALFAYSSGRLIARVVLAIGVAAATRDVDAVILALIGLEGLRLLLAGVAFLRFDRAAGEPPVAGGLRAQWAFCLPSGAASLLALLTRNLSSIVVARALGRVALAQYAIGRFGEPMVVTLRNSLSSVVLPEMVSREREQRRPLELWRRSTTVNALLLFPVVVFVGLCADVLVRVAFGAAYAPAAGVLQIYLLVVVRECFDFAPALRAANRPRPLVTSNLAALGVAAAVLAFAVPSFGVRGAMLAVLAGSLVDAGWLALQTARCYGVPASQLGDWRSLGSIALAAVLPGVLLHAVLPGVRLDGALLLPAAVLYAIAYVALLAVLRVRELTLMAAWAGRLVERLSTVPPFRRIRLAGGPR